eukprot:4125382-Amphidinium_carterae.1
MEGEDHVVNRIRAALAAGFAAVEPWSEFMMRAQAYAAMAREQMGIAFGGATSQRRHRVYFGPLIVQYRYRKIVGSEYLSVTIRVMENDSLIIFPGR